MNEADIPKNEDWTEPLNLGNSPQPEKENCPFYSLFPNQNRVIAKLPPANSSVPGIVNDEQWEEEQWGEEQQSSSSSTMEIGGEDEETSVDSQSNGVLELDSAQWQSVSELGVSEDELATNSQKDWIAEPDSDKQAAIDAEFKQLLDLNQELCSANNDLYQQVEELTLALADTQQALQKQKNRSSIAESMLSQQTQENSADREQIQSLFQQLEIATQTIQRQESLIESYKAHFESSQQRLAQLERECTQLHSKYSEQSYLLLQSENSCRELRTRLMRQQRQTLQFKAALSKCLDTPVPGDLEDNEAGDGIDTSTRRQSSISSSKLRSFLTNAQPIRPWSDLQTESFNDDDISAQADPLSEPSAQVWQESVSEFSGWDATVKENIFTEHTSLVDGSPPEAVDDDGTAQVYIWDTTMEKDLTFGSEDGAINEVSIWDIEASEEDISPQKPATSFTSEIANEQVRAETVFNPESSDSEEPNLEEKLDSVIEMFFNNQKISQSSPSVETDDTDSHQAPVWEAFVTSADTDVSDDDNPEHNKDNLLDESPWFEDNLETDFNSGQFTDNASNENSPSPVVYPDRPRKPRKSFASVELPDFPSRTKSE